MGKVGLAIRHYGVYIPATTMIDQRMPWWHTGIIMAVQISITNNT